MDKEDLKENFQLNKNVSRVASKHLEAAQRRRKLKIDQIEPRRFFGFVEFVLKKSLSIRFLHFANASLKHLHALHHQGSL